MEMRMCVKSEKSISAGNKPTMVNLENSVPFENQNVCIENASHDNVSDNVNLQDDISDSDCDLDELSPLGNAQSQTPSHGQTQGHTCSHTPSHTPNHTQASSRPTRVRKLPGRFKDFVMK